MEKNLWQFIGNNGDFESNHANKVNSLYFPLCNSYPLMSSVTPDLHGDIKTGFDSFLMEPVSRHSLSDSKISRNFWVYINNNTVWSACGFSKSNSLSKFDQFKLEAGMLWHKVIRKNKKIGLAANITSFVPSNNEPVEIMQVELTNISSKTIKFSAIAAIPIFARSPNNLHDHRHVTSLLSRVKKEKAGIVVKPTLFFDETGHRKNYTAYFTFGFDSKSKYPEHIFQTQEEFTKDESGLDEPQAVFKNIKPNKDFPSQGKEALAGLRFESISLKPKQSYSYFLVMGVAGEESKIKSIFSKFNTPEKISASLKETKEFWKNYSNNIKVDTADQAFDNWFSWVNIQPLLRKIFGCSFLPDFDYGKGGRGWRDLWQDCLSLILNCSNESRKLLVNNFKGVRIDGTNATIIGTLPGEFIADRNNITRVWMDHGIWPLITTALYINQTSDIGVLFEEVSYFKDMQIWRSRKKDNNWLSSDSKELKDENGNPYKGSILEHILVQHLVQFFNCGLHNNIRLENADWNDGLDLAGDFGESVAFSCMYAKNLKTICELLERIDQKEISLFKELQILLDSAGQNKINYDDVGSKQKLLDTYFAAVEDKVSGKMPINKELLILDLTNKAEWMFNHIRNEEWLKEGFFNGYYDNESKRSDGKINNKLSMTLTGQVFPILSGIATKEQMIEIFANAKKYLKDKKLGGFRLNTDFAGDRLNLGRAFSFAFGEKENGAFFNHMSIMFSYALYAQGLAKEGFEVLSSIYEMALNSNVSRIYPCLPEYFNLQGKGMYSYLTGSASWYILTLLTQVFGIRGNYGDLIIAPKLVAAQFSKSNKIKITAPFAGVTFSITFINTRKMEFGKYRIKKVVLDSRTLTENADLEQVSLKLSEINKLDKSISHALEIFLE